MNIPTAKSTNDIFAQLELGSLAIIEVFQCNSKHKMACLNLKLKLHTVQRALLERVHSIFPPLTSLSTSTSHTSKQPTPKEMGQNIIGTKTTMFMYTFLQTFQSMSVINFSLLWIRQHFIGK